MYMPGGDVHAQGGMRAGGMHAKEACVPRWHACLGRGGVPRTHSPCGQNDIHV